MSRLTTLALKLRCLVLLLLSPLRHLLASLGLAAPEVLLGLAAPEVLGLRLLLFQHRYL